MQRRERVMSAVSNLSFHEFGDSKKTVVQDSFDVFSNFATETPYSFAKSVYVLGIDVPRMLGWMDEKNAAGSFARHQLSLFKLSRSPNEFFSSVNTTARSAWSYFTGKAVVIKKGDKELKPEVKSLPQVFRSALGIINPIYEMGAFMTKAILFIPKASIRSLEGVNGISMMISFAWTGLEDLRPWGQYLKPENLATRRLENIEAMLKVMKDVSYFAIGVIVTLTTFTTACVAPYVVTSLSASTVVFTILLHYYKEIGKPKTINLKEGS